MQSISIFSVLATALFTLAGAQTTTTPVTGTLGNASTVENNPPGIIYTATLPTTEFNNPSDPRGNVKGSISATANPNGIGVSFTINFSNLPTSGGPFLYHIHSQPVPADGNCTGTLGHLDPFLRGETPSCDATLPQTCQVGDLAGKHGKIVSDPFTASYSDEFASTVNGIGAFFGNRSFVVHFANTTRITCANFTEVGSTVGGSGNSSTGSAAPSGTTTAAPLQYTGLGAGPRLMVPSFALLGVTTLSLFL